MTLLHIIKYPITVDFKQEDLERMPAELLIDWWKNEPELHYYQQSYGHNSDYIINTRTSNTARAREINNVFRYYCHPKHKSTVLKSLKKYILEYDSIPCD